MVVVVVVVGVYIIGIRVEEHRNDSETMPALK